ncbi:hypothetical protein EON68_05000, partial [archaeon]
MQAVPHFGYCDEIYMDEAMAARTALKAAAEKAGVKFSYLPLIVKATSVALSAYPQLNAHVSADATEVIVKGAHNIGVAMDTPRGLIVPNIKNVQSLSLFEIAAELSRLQALAAESKLGEADLSGGTFTYVSVRARVCARARPRARARTHPALRCLDVTPLCRLSNIGTIGGTYASPVLFMPQVAIGAIGKIQKV